MGADHQSPRHIPSQARGIITSVTNGTISRLAKGARSENPPKKYAQMGAVAMLDQRDACHN